MGVRCREIMSPIIISAAADASLNCVALVLRTGVVQSTQHSSTRTFFFFSLVLLRGEEKERVWSRVLRLW